MSKKIRLSRGLFSTVDDADFAELSQYRWHLSGSPRALYATRSQWIDGKTVAVRMHNLLLPTHGALVVDHVNGDCLDNRRSNLRLCTPAQNQWNRHAPARGCSRFTGVSPDRKRWRARIACASHRFNIGIFDREVDAAVAYDEKCRELRGTFARPNFSRVVTQSALRHVLCETRGRFFSVCFIKRTDGSERCMLCRTGVTPLPGPSIIEITGSNDLISVWDVQKHEFRFVPLEGILWIRFKGTYISVARRKNAYTRDQTTQGLLFARTAG